MTRHTRILLMMSAFAWGIAGCAPSGGSSAASSAPAGAQSHEQEHGIPDHKPRSFRSAIDELDKRLAAHPSQTGLAELRDILRWLPEIAADSDLSEADWNDVKRAAIALLEKTSAWTAESWPEVESCREGIRLMATLVDRAEAQHRRPVNNDDES